MERISIGLQALQARLREILQARADAENTYTAVAKKSEQDRKTFLETHAREQEAQLEKTAAGNTARRTRIDELWSRRAANIKTAGARKRSAIERQINERKAAWMERRKDAQARSIAEHQQKLLESDRRHAEKLEFLESLATFAKELRTRIERFASDRGVRLSIPAETRRGTDKRTETATDEDELPDDPEETAEKLDQRLAKVEDTLNASRRLGPLIPPLAAYAIVLILHAGAWGWLYKFTFASPFVFGIFASCFIFLAVAYAVCGASKHKVAGASVLMMEQLQEDSAAIQREKKRERQRNMSEITALGIERIRIDNEEAEKYAQKINEYNKPLSDAHAKLQAQLERILHKISEHKRAAIERVEQESARTSAALRATLAESGKRKNDAISSAALKAEQTRSAAIETLAAAWKAELAQFDAMVKDAYAKFAASHPPWNAFSARDLRLPDTFCSEVPIGTLNLDLKSLAPTSDAKGPFSLESVASAKLPMFLSFPLQGSLLITTSSRRNETLGLVFGTVLNLLRSFPPAKVKMTIIDPVGLGQTFAGLMHLADYDESLVNGRIWSDNAHIERKLTELTEHMEKVIQKYLRNRYKTIDEYNREAGQMAEPYRFVVIGDFPSGFSELALERLASIIKSGVRCGVYTIIIHNEKQKLPPQIDMSELRKNGFVIRERGDGFVVDDERLNLVRLASEEIPSSVQIDELVNAIGKQCREAARVQVPFEIVMPKADQYWSLTTEKSVRIPLGKAGADRLQYMELGLGTAQHALIAGKTGSGKSNLFHVIVTNAASWYSPREMEFYLIDFKKGVEFKTYGTHRLRHARVVAIESDREFAISVLRRIDSELTHRGEMFRKARVQDFGSFRKASPETVIPRTLLMIDEFQEFFVDDDAVAQEASLLLDRIVRQGRAFGIHVVLGSQTLGGTYTLSKSTMGQVGVRIALACNEQDSYLILSDDNSAAALLTRPGEAIYNDHAGLVEGNNPFQAVWLPKDLQDNYLSILQRKAVETGMDSVEPIVVFEGSSLADLRNNMLLRGAALCEPRAANARPRIWLGDPNAIKGPTEVEFGRQAGANMMVVGHRGDTEIAMACATVISLAAAHSPKDLAIRILDGTRADAPAKERLQLLAKSLPMDIEIADYRRGPELIQELNVQMKSRQQPGASSEKHVFFIVLGLEKFRMLRQEDEFSFSSKDDDAVSPAKGFTDLLIEGPNAGIHSLIWCDTLSNLNRSLSRKTLREFEMRVLFQMSQSDSSELVDSPAANRLGMYNALLYSAESGQIEKFRPYAAPDKELIAEFAVMLAAREARVVKARA